MALYPNRRGKKRRNVSTGKKSRVDQLVDTAIKEVKKKTRRSPKLMAEGVAIHTLVNSRTSTNVLENVSDLQNPDLNNREKMIDLSRKLRQAEGICGSVADLLTDFAITRGSFYSDNVDLKKMLNRWSFFINSVPDLAAVKGVILPTPCLRYLSRKIFDDYIVDGDAVFSLFWQNGVKMSPNDPDTLFLPTSIKVLDSTTLSIDPDLAKLGIEQITLELDDNVKKRITDPESDADKFLSKNVPPEWVKLIKSGDDIILDPNVTYHIKRNAKDYKPWGNPYFVKAFSAVAAKRRLQAVDDATIDGLINRFTIFKLGLADREKNPAYHIPSKARVAALVNILTSQKRSNAAVWPGPDLEVIDIGPDGKILDMDGKFRQADKDILRSLHVSPLLIDGTSSGQTTSDFIAFVATEVGLDAIRSEIEAAFTSIAKEIAIANNIDYEQLYYKFETQLLKDQENVRNFAIKVFELGGLSVETFVNTMGYNFEAEKQLKEEEVTSGVKEIFVNPNIPGFTGVAPTGIDEGEDPEVDKDKDGRPPEPEADAKQAAIANPLDSPTIFYSLYSQIFEKIKTDVVRQAELGAGFDSVQLILLNGFNHFRMLVEAQLTLAYRKESGGNITHHLDQLFSWNNRFIDKFYIFLRDEIKSDVDSSFKILDSPKVGYRVFLYATESYRKAIWAGRITKASLEGHTQAIWKCTNEDSSCIENHALVFSLDILIDIFPGHPNCQCKLEFI